MTQADPTGFGQLLTRQGYSPIAIPLFFAQKLPQALDGLDPRTVHSLLLTSRYAAEAAASWGDRLRTLKVTCLGPATAAPLLEIGIPVEISPFADGISAVSALGLTPNSRVLFLRGDPVTASTLDAVQKSGAQVTERIVYRMMENPDAEATLKSELPLDRVTLWSAAGARRWAALSPPPIPAIAIGQTTAEAARSVGIEVSTIARSPALMLEAVQDSFG